MPFFFLAFFGLMIVAGMLVAAALTFTVCAAIPALRSSSITAPVAALVASPYPLLILFTFSVHHMFIMSATGPHPWLKFSAAALLLALILWIVAWAAVLICRFILEYLPPLLTSLFDLKPQLLLQAVLLVGSVCSALVNLATSASLVYYFREQLLKAIPVAILGAIFTAICIHALLQITHPERYAPKPIPMGWKKLLFRTTMPDQSMQ